MSTSTKTLAEVHDLLLEATAKLAEADIKLRTEDPVFCQVGAPPTPDGIDKALREIAGALRVLLLEKNLREMKFHRS